jgi:hypothetical protein
MTMTEPAPQGQNAECKTQVTKASLLEEGEDITFSKEVKSTADNYSVE